MPNKTLTALLHSAFFRSIVLLTSGSVASQLIIFAGLPIIARIYNPEDFGLFAIFSATSGVLLTISSLRFELAIPVAKNWRDAKHVFSLSVIINCFLAFFSLVVVVFFAPEIAGWFGESQLKNILWLLPFVLLSGGIFKSLNYLALWETAYKQISISKIWQGSALIISQIILGFMGSGALGLAFGLALGQLAGMFCLLGNTDLISGVRDASNSHARTLIFLRKNKDYARFDVPASLVGALSHHLPNIIFAALFSPAAAGVYYIVERIYAVPAGVVGRSIGQVIHANIRSDFDEGRLQQRILKVLVGLALAIAVPVSVLHYYAEPIFTLLLGESWRGAGEVAAWLVLSVAIQFVYSALSMVLVTTGGQLKNLFVHSSLFLLKLAGIMIGYAAGSFILAIQCLVFAQVAGYGIALVVLTLHTKHISEQCEFNRIS